MRLEEMGIGLVIADFEMSYTTSFQHTARAKYSVDFTSSNITHIKEKLQALKENIQHGNVKPVHVGYDFGLPEAEHIESLLLEIEKRYLDAFPVKAVPNRKIYHLFNQLREAEAQPPKQIAKEVLNEILTPPKAPKQTRKGRIKVEAEALSKQRALDLLRKNSAKKKG